MTEWNHPRPKNLDDVETRLDLLAYVAECTIDFCTKLDVYATRMQESVQILSSESATYAQRAEALKHRTR